MNPTKSIDWNDDLAKLTRGDYERDHRRAEDLVRRALETLQVRRSGEDASATLCRITAGVA